MVQQLETENFETLWDCMYTCGGLCFWCRDLL